MTTPALAKIGLVVAATAIALGLAEVALRVHEPNLGFRFPSFRITDDRFTSRADRSSDDRGIRYVFDRDGLRIGADERADAVTTILFVGDSFTEGLGVDAQDAFPAVVCERLRPMGIPARCRNAGVSGFGTAHELRLLRRFLERGDNIDAVVFQVLPNNDLRDNWEDGGFALVDGQVVALDPPHIPRRVWWRDTILGNPVVRGSHVAKLVANASFNGVGMDPHLDQSALDLEAGLLRAAKSAADARGIPILFLVAATAWELDRVATEPFDERSRLDFVANTLRMMGVPMIDSRTVTTKPEHYIPNDGHFSPAGNAMIGAALAEQLAPLLRRSRSDG